MPRGPGDVDLARAGQRLAVGDGVGRKRLADECSSRPPYGGITRIRFAGSPARHRRRTLSRPPRLEGAKWAPPSDSESTPLPRRISTGNPPSSRRVRFEIRKRGRPPAALPPGGAAASTADPPRRTSLAAGARRLAPIALIGAGGLGALRRRRPHPRRRSTPARPASRSLWLARRRSGASASPSRSPGSRTGKCSRPKSCSTWVSSTRCVEALCLGIMFHSMPIRPDVMPRGWTAVAVWILAYPADRAEHARQDDRRDARRGR